jgi:hypothetical protein
MTSVDAPPQVFSPEFGSPEFFGVYSELVHSTFRGWTPRFRLASDDVTIEPNGWRMESEAVEDASSWRADDHWEELINCILSEQSNLKDRTYTHVRRLAKNKASVTPKPRHVTDADRIYRAKSILENKFNKQIGLMINTHDDSPLKDTTIQSQLKAEFGDLLTFVFTDSKQNPDVIRPEMNHIQVTAQEFLFQLANP